MISYAGGLASLFRPVDLKPVLVRYSSKQGLSLLKRYKPGPNNPMACPTILITKDSTEIQTFSKV